MALDVSGIDLEKLVEILHPLIDINKIIAQIQESLPRKAYPKIYNKLDAINEIDDVKKSKDKTRLILEEFSMGRVIDWLLLTNQDAAACKLSSETIKLDLTDLIDLTQCDPRNGHKPYFSFGDAQGEEKFLTIEGKQSDSKTAAYAMNNDPRGYCLLINNLFTIGTYKEMQRFRNIFHKLKYKVKMEKNLTANQIFEKLQFISKKDALDKHNAFVFIYLGHGEENGYINGFDDNKTLEINSLIELFITENCEFLKQKPRMFFFNCCRGKNPVDGERYKTRTDLSTRMILPKHDDFIICYSTLEGYDACFDLETGSLFGKHLADSFIENVNYKDLNTIITKAYLKMKDNESYTFDKDSIQPFDWIQRGTRRVYFIL